MKFKYSCIKNILSILFFLMVLVSCGSDCLNDVNNVVRKEKYKFCITEKAQENRFHILKGKDSNGIVQEFKHNYSNLYDAALIGDTLSKEEGRAAYLLIKKDTTIIFPCYCDGFIVDDPR